MPQATIIEALEEMTPKRRAEIVRGLEALVAAIGANAVEPRMLFEDEPKRHQRNRR